MNKTCGHKIEKNFNFCPICGAPLNDVSRESIVIREQRIKLETLYALVNIVEDEKTLTQIRKIIDKMI